MIIDMDGKVKVDNYPPPPVTGGEGFLKIWRKIYNLK